MTQPIEFAKLSGSGNDFICLDGRDGRFDELLAEADRVGHFAKVLCRRGLGVGADGVIFATAPEAEGMADLGARHFEPDGSEATLCGNGTACFVRWADDDGWGAGQELRVLTAAGVVRGRRSDGQYVRVCIPLPEDMRTDLPLRAGGQRWTCDYVVTGVPHVLAYVDDAAAIDISHAGPLLRHHPMFAPLGANANFVQVLREGELALRTFETGVEGETLACGTGSAAAAIMAARRFGWDKAYLSGQKPVLIHARSGDVLRVYFEISDDAVRDLCLETVVRYLYRGVLHADLAAAALGTGAPRTP
ncbi:MAG: diaminopimelate epimerase [Phycisphaerae bacterium]|nr:diaminopimelate epimerase [Phycisphaerae bacterium]